MDKAVLKQRIKALHDEVATWEGDGTIPAGTAKEVFLFLLAGICQGESIVGTFDP